MSSISRQKRARSPAEGVAIPAEDCTRDTFDQHTNLNDRQFLSWALQTEARVRFAKLQGRDSYFGESTTLNSDYLLDLYPARDDDKDGNGPLARERYIYTRKNLPYLQNMRAHDSSFETLTRLTIDQPQSNDLAKTTTQDGLEYVPIPPNLLYFEIILEAFMGYRVPSFHSKDPSQPRAAIMGGAVVAALTAWRDEKVISVFVGEETNLLRAMEADDKATYQSAKENVVQALHRYFLHEYKSPFFRKNMGGRHPPNSPFGMGDVDIFLQASPLTQSLMTKMQDLPVEVRDTICSNLGGSGFVHRDLQAFATSLCDSHLKPQFDGFMGSPRNPWEERSGRKFCYALTTNGLSFALGDEEHAPPYDTATQRWPRTTQLIMLNEKADLVAGLMDFDISVASCAYDGVGVYVTPRAAFSLKTLSQVVTPFVYEEKRNRSRIKKYYERGFQAFVIDPYCSHDKQCVKEDAIKLTEQSHVERKENESEDEDDKLEARQFDFTAANEGIKLVSVRGARWRSTDFHSHEVIDAIESLQAQEDGWGLVGNLICNRCDGEARDHYGYEYSASLVEKSPGHAVEYFAKLDNWSEEKRIEVLELPEHQRFICRKCRFHYGLSVVLEQAPATFASVGTVDEVLHGDWSYHHCGSTTFRPAFYNGGAFSSFFVGENARLYHQLISVMESQQRIEKARFFSQHGTLEGYRMRFVYGGELESVFNDAANKNLSSSGRAPVGLNPERFIAKCKGCRDWLHECEYSVEYCQRCMESKPAAIGAYVED